MTVKKAFRLGILVTLTVCIVCAGNIPWAARAQTALPVTFRIDVGQERAPISPYIYGTNQDLPGFQGWTARRLGGNRLTGYNWENNASNAGKDWRHTSDRFLCEAVGVSGPCDAEPGSVMKTFHEQSLAYGAYTILTLQMAGYVARDMRGVVREDQVAPSNRWDEVVFVKGSDFTYPPDPDDGRVYMDEFVNMMVEEYGGAASPSGVRGYALDNEPALWFETHPRLHPEKLTCVELIERSTAMAKMVKSLDPAAEIYGPALYGFNAYLTLQDAPDWREIKAARGYNWFIDYYLEQMRQAGEAEGMRLLDVLDVHWYSEARGDDKRIVFEASGAGSEGVQKARVQAPRSLWDPDYVEVSWIAQYFGAYLPLLPQLQNSIDTYYPGTKLAFTEFGYGGEGHITGGIAATDVLGIFGKYGIYLAAHWSTESETDYVTAAYNLYRNYDGNGATYGDTKVHAETSDVENSSVYASVFEGDNSELHIIVINKSFDSPLAANFEIAGGAAYRSLRVWGFDQDSSEIAEAEPMVLSGGNFSYTIPPLTVYHLVLSTEGLPTPTPEPTPTPKPTPVPTTAPTATPVFEYSPVSHKGSWCVGGVILILFLVGVFFLLRGRGRKK